MRKKRVQVLLANLMIAASISLTGCAGIIKPTIGESGGNVSMTQSADAEQNGMPETAPDGNMDTGGEKGADDDNFAMPEGMDIPGLESIESQPKPEMAGNIVQKFEVVKQVSGSRGDLLDLCATVELFDEENADGNTALISVVLGETSLYTACIWDKENGQYTLAVDEFTNYVSKDIKGVPTIIGVRYNFGMDGKGTVDIPQIDASENGNES